MIKILLWIGGILLALYVIGETFNHINPYVGLLALGLFVYIGAKVFNKQTKLK